ncbi:MAG: 3-methylcrotonyl-CoA carboxylase [Paracoccaceae bacterium]
MFSKILIANRGEIACRVIDTCRRLGVATVAVHSDTDAGARHVAMADEAVGLGGALPSESYLRQDAVIAAAVKTGAQAIHPGYGFLSENPEFVTAVEAAGLVFIGPSADAIRAMGLKDAAKALMEEAGVPVVPGYHGADQEPGRLEVEAAAIGYPVLIKAVAGGGGKGMRRVDDPGDFLEALEAARAEALGAFGNDAVLIEKFVEKPRHIEVQVFGDGQDAVHLFERDCSLQRRHQKVIEEAPAPGMTSEMRAAMGAAAVRAARAVNYAGAGTVEFIVDASDGLRPDRFYFMEMNTRLQVEHPVTEMITGVDLVAWQLQVAAGGGLPLVQEELGISGHAFEARIYAEDPAAGFLPATGVLEHLSFAPGVRVDAGVRAGDEISPYYDPMIAKVTVHGPSRDVALQRMARALRQTRIAGCMTNLGFLSALVRHEGFASGEVDTGLIGRDQAALTEVAPPDARIRALASVAAIRVEAGPLSGFSLWAPSARDVHLVVGGDGFVARVAVLGPERYEVGVADRLICVGRDGDAWVLDGDKVAAHVVCGPDAVHVFEDVAYRFDIPDPLARGGSAGGAQDATLAPMPGLVKAVFVQAGDRVVAGDRLAVLEAMKMEHSLRADRDGVIGAVLVASGAQVAAGDRIVELREAEE